MSKMTFQELEEQIMSLAKEKGFGTNASEINVAEKIALIQTEVCEAYIAYRHKNLDGKDGFNEELADVIIRTIHLASSLGVDIEKEIDKKMSLNFDREWKSSDLNETFVK